VLQDVADDLASVCSPAPPDVEGTLLRLVNKIVDVFYVSVALLED
jgi:hypothetical protein